MVKRPPGPFMVRTGTQLVRVVEYWTVVVGSSDGVEFKLKAVFGLRGMAN